MSEIFIPWRVLGADTMPPVIRAGSLPWERCHVRLRTLGGGAAYAWFGREFTSKAQAQLEAIPALTSGITGADGNPTPNPSHDLSAGIGTAAEDYIHADAGSVSLITVYAANSVDGYFLFTECCCEQEREDRRRLCAVLDRIAAKL